MVISVNFRPAQAGKSRDEVSMGGDQLLSWRTNKDSKGNAGSHSNPGFPLKEKDQRIRDWS